MRTPKEIQERTYDSWPTMPLVVYVGVLFPLFVLLPLGGYFFGFDISLKAIGILVVILIFLPGVLLISMKRTKLLLKDDRAEIYSGRGLWLGRTKETVYWAAVTDWSVRQKYLNDGRLNQLVFDLGGRKVIAMTSQYENDPNFRELVEHVGQKVKLHYRWSSPNGTSFYRESSGYGMPQ